MLYDGSAMSESLTWSGGYDEVIGVMVNAERGIAEVVKAITASR